MKSEPFTLLFQKIMFDKINFNNKEKEECKNG